MRHLILKLGCNVGHRVRHRWSVSNVKRLQLSRELKYDLKQRVNASSLLYKIENDRDCVPALGGRHARKVLAQKLRGGSAQGVDGGKGARWAGGGEGGVKRGVEGGAITRVTCVSATWTSSTGSLVVSRSGDRSWAAKKISLKCVQIGTKCVEREACLRRGCRAGCGWPGRRPSWGRERSCGGGEFNEKL